MLILFLQINSFSKAQPFAKTRDPTCRHRIGQINPPVHPVQWCNPTGTNGYTGNVQ